MSRGLGRRQLLFLRALVALDGEERCEHFWRVSAIVNKAIEIDDGLRDADAAREERRKAYWKNLREAARSGDDRAMELYRIEAILAADARARAYKGRPRRRKVDWLEESLNPSRVLHLLEKRGLVERIAINGDGAARLTEAGAENIGQGSRENSAAPRISRR